MEPFPAPRATRFLLLQKGQLMRSDLTVLNAQMFNHSLHAHMVRDRLHLGQLNISLEPLNLVSVRAYPRRDCHDGRGGVLFAAAKFLLSQAIASAQQSRRAREIEEAAQWMMGTIVFCPDKLALTAVRRDSGDVRAFTYRELAAQADRIVVGLARLGVGRNDVAMQLPNWWQLRSFLHPVCKVEIPQGRRALAGDQALGLEAAVGTGAYSSSREFATFSSRRSSSFSSRRRASSVSLLAQ